MVPCFRPADAVRDGGASVMSQTLPSEVMIFMVTCGPASLTPSVTVPVMAVTSTWHSRIRSSVALVGLRCLHLYDGLGRLRSGDPQREALRPRGSGRSLACDAETREGRGLPQ